MPDYDPKDIPRLDDIIEKDLADDVQSDNAEPDDTATEAEKNDPDILSEGAIEQDIDDSLITETEAQPDELNDISALEPDNTEATQFDEITPQISEEPIAVELIVKDIVKQLLPDLEQQITLLLQQALEEKLHEKTIKPADTPEEN